MSWGCVADSPATGNRQPATGNRGPGTGWVPGRPLPCLARVVVLVPNHSHTGSVCSLQAADRHC
jgi:hypothetical protein